MKIIDLKNIDLLEQIGTTYESQEVGSFDAFEDEVCDFLKNGRYPVGDKLPWNMTHSDVAFAGGQITIWAGINGHGKSTLVNQVFANWAGLGIPVLIASMEMFPRETIACMATQTAGCHPSKEFTSEWIKRISSHSYIYNCQDRVPVENMLGLCHYAGKELGVKHIMIDSLTMCGVGRDDYSKQAEFVDLIRVCAKLKNIHIHIVAHMRKGDKESSKPNKFDIRGAGEITDLADKVFIVARNKRREEQLKLRARGEQIPEKYLRQPDCWLSIEKNRQDGTERTYPLYFIPEAEQYVSKENRVMPIGGGDDTIS